MKRTTLLKFVSLCLCAVLCIGAFAGCKTADGGKTVYWLLSSSPKNLDPQTAKSESELQIIKNCFTGLFERDENGELTSSVVEHYTVTSDGLKYTFELYPDLSWFIVEGRSVKKYAPLKAQDFVFAIKRLFTDNPSADVMNVLSSIKNADRVLAGEKVSSLAVKAVDDRTLTVTLSRKNSALLEAFTSPELFPCQEEFFSSTSGRYGLSSDALIFNGSFCMQNWGESSIKLTANTKSDNKPSVSSILFYQPKSTREHTALLTEGEIDAALLSCEQYDALENKDSFSINKYTATVWAMVLNPAHEFWQNENLRKAVLTCTDRSVIKSGGHHSATDLLIDKNAEVFSENYRALAGYPSTPEFDSTAAASLYSTALSQLGVSQIYNCEILIAEESGCKENFAALNQVYQRDLSLYFSPNYVSQSTLISKVKSGEFAAAIIPLTISFNTPECILEYFDESSTSCIFRVQNDAFKTALTQAQRATSPADAAASYLKAEEAIYGTNLVSPLFFENGYFVSSKSTSGYYLDSSGAVIFKSVTKK